MLGSLITMKLGTELVVSSYTFKYKDKSDCNRCCCAWSDLRSPLWGWFPIPPLLQVLADCKSQQHFSP